MLSFSGYAWIVSSWSKFKLANADTGLGLLRLTIDEAGMGGEVQSSVKFGFGDFEWEMQTGPEESGQISSCFLFYNDSETEIDIELEGSRPRQLEFTNWKGLGAKQYTPWTLPFNGSRGFHKYKVSWRAGQIAFYVDGVPAGLHTLNIPTSPAYAMMNFYSTNAAGWGGAATPGVRSMYFKSFSYKAA